MAIATNREAIDDGSPSGARVRGLARQVINGAGTTKQLLVSESGALCVFGTAAGQIYTLPIIGANDVGMFFDFCTTVTSTTAYSVNTGQAADKIGGGLLMGSTGANEADFLPATIASTVSIDLDSVTTGENLGSWFRLTVVSSTEWYCGGMAVGAGAMADPFA